MKDSSINSHQGPMTKPSERGQCRAFQHLLVNNNIQQINCDYAQGRCARSHHYCPLYLFHIVICKSMHLVHGRRSKDPVCDHVVNNHRHIECCVHGERTYQNQGNSRFVSFTGARNARRDVRGHYRAAAASFDVRVAPASYCFRLPGTSIM